MNIWIKRLHNFVRRPRWSSIGFWLRRLGPQSPIFSYHVISTQPLVLMAFDYPNLFLLLEELRGREAWIFIFCSWTLEGSAEPAFGQRLMAWSKTCPAHHFIYLANSPVEKAILDRHGIPSIFCNQNCFIDETIFAIRPDEPKRFRAIYDARLTPFKRHALAARVPGLALITYITSANHDEGYVESTRRGLTGAHWLNGPFSEHPGTLDADEVCRFVNQSRVGLMLSAVEGPNYASSQYLLCGLPVVTTRSQGGRDVFFHPDYAVTVDDTPEAVASGVDELIGRALDPCLIRERMLAIMWQHRRTFLREVESILKSQGVERDLEADWSRIFIHRMLGSHSRPDFLRFVRSLPAQNKRITKS